MTRQARSRVRVRDSDSRLPPLRWVAEEDLVYDLDANTLHRPGCRLLPAGRATSRLPARSALTLIWAPVVCQCRPDVTLALGGDRDGAELD
jgi:hypothetical protein